MSERNRRIKNAEKLPVEQVVTHTLNRLADAGFQRVIGDHPAAQFGYNQYLLAPVACLRFVLSTSDGATTTMIEIDQSMANYAPHEFGPESTIWLTMLAVDNTQLHSSGQSVAEFLGAPKVAKNSGVTACARYTQH